MNRIVTLENQKALKRVINTYGLDLTTPHGIWKVWDALDLQHWLQTRSNKEVHAIAATMRPALAHVNTLYTLQRELKEEQKLAQNVSKVRGFRLINNIERRRIEDHKKMWKSINAAFRSLFTLVYTLFVLYIMKFYFGPTMLHALGISISGLITMYTKFVQVLTKEISTMNILKHRIKYLGNRRIASTNVNSDFSKLKEFTKKAATMHAKSKDIENIVYKFERAGVM